MAFQQKVAIVAGASQSIGAGVVRGYRNNGFLVVANSRDVSAFADKGVIEVSGDIAERDVAEQVVKTAVERFGRIDTLINSASSFTSKSFTEYTIEDLRKTIDVNLVGFFHVTQLAVAQMLKQGAGHIVQINAALLNQPIAGVPNAMVSLTKGGLDAVTRSLAIEYAKRGIRVNAVAPGIIKTPMHAPEFQRFFAALHPVGRMGEVAEVVDAILYLERATFVTGETLNVDGGQHAGRW
jgi:NAD(P)-dependent dehydrogenase (short-subunit alcohol dehydrogenase family)